MMVILCTGAAFFAGLPLGVADLVAGDPALFGHHQALRSLPAMTVSTGLQVILSTAW